MCFYLRYIDLYSKLFVYLNDIIHLFILGKSTFLFDISISKCKNIIVFTLIIKYRLLGKKTCFNLYTNLHITHNFWLIITVFSYKKNWTPSIPAIYIFPYKTVLNYYFILKKMRETIYKLLYLHNQVAFWLVLKSWDKWYIANKN